MPKDVSVTTPVVPLSKNHVYIQQRLQRYQPPPSTDSTITVRYQIGNLTDSVWTPANESGEMSFDTTAVSALAAIAPNDGETLGDALDRILTASVITQLVANGVIDGGSAG
jgi:hypothetical protein|tara:strand:- start:78 stop:410 length:333 start_codon:yes stop_codon:yes gene_type:complete